MYWVRYAGGDLAYGQWGTAEECTWLKGLLLAAGRGGKGYGSAGVGGL